MREHGLDEARKDSQEDEVPDENWHRGMLDCQDQHSLSMATTGFERASKENRDAFMFKLEQDSGKFRHMYGEKGAIPSDMLAESLFKFLEITLSVDRG